MERASTTARNSLIGPDLCFLRQPHIGYEARTVTDRNNDRSRLADAIKLHGDAVDASLACGGAPASKDAQLCLPVDFAG